MRRRSLVCVVAMVLLFFAACVTVNIYFPATAVEKTAEEIVTEVRGEQKEEGTKEAPQSHIMETFFAVGNIVVRDAHAQQELQVSNPAIRSLKASLKARFPQLGPYLKGGNIGENNEGLVTIKDLQGLNLKDQAAAKRLVAAENKDREQLYMEVTRALNIDPSQTPRVQKIFAKEWQKSAPKGTWIQDDKGAWMRK